MNPANYVLNLMLSLPASHQNYIVVRKRKSTPQLRKRYSNRSTHPVFVSVAPYISGNGYAYPTCPWPAKHNISTVTTTRAIVKNLFELFPF